MVLKTLRDAARPLFCEPARRILQRVAGSTRKKPTLQGAEERDAIRAKGFEHHP